MLQRALVIHLNFDHAWAEHYPIHLFEPIIFIIVLLNIFQKVCVCPNSSGWSEQQGHVQKTWFVMEMHSMLQGAMRFTFGGWLGLPRPPSVSLSNQY